ncbi:MAG: clan AA aspartic protease [Brumimicrobium sp.]|nr:clan AA aspartic protease [Brumimicrobium sp.]
MKKIFIFLMLVFTLNSCMIKYNRMLMTAVKKEKIGTQMIASRNEFGFSIIPIQINNKTYHFIFDTGAQVTLISSQLVEELGLKRLSQIKISDSQEAKDKLDIYKINEAYIGNVHYSNIAVVAHDFKDNMLSCINIDGVLGMNIIGLSNWEIDYERKQITLFDIDSITNYNSANYIQFKTKSNRPLLKLFANGKEENFLLDTGKNSEEIELSHKKDTSDIIRTTIGYTSFGLFGKSKIDTLQTFFGTLADSASFAIDKVVFESSSNPGRLIGNGFLIKNFASVFFDFKTDRLYFKNKENKSINLNYFPIRVAVLNNTAFVSSLDFGFSDFAIGDTIIGINDMSIENGNSACDIINAYWKAKATESSISVAVLKNQAVIRKKYEIITH